MPLSKPTPQISLHFPSTPFTTTPTCHLTTIPPELLLSILTHLPPSSLYPLSQTSHHLHTFLHTHAASICNTLITTHYTRANSILRSKFNGSWLLPTHPAILNEEQRILRDKILFSGCKCAPCHLELASSTSSMDVLIEDEGAAGERGLGCKARKEIEGCLRLSKPGPQYVVFLEKYGWEIVTRWSMGRSSAPDSIPLPPSPTSSTSTATADTEDGEAEEERQRQEREKEEAMFEFMVGNYCVRRFLDAAEKTISSIPSSASPPIPQSSPKIQFQKLQRKLRKKMRVSKEKAVRVAVQVEEVVLDDEIGEARRTAPQSGARRMMFGEITPPLNEIDEKTALVQKKERGERWEDGLLWYYGLPSLRASGEREEEVEVEEVQEKVKEKERGCVDVFRRGMGIIGRRVRGIFLGRCLRLRKGVMVGGFRALEG